MFSVLSALGDNGDCRRSRFGCCLDGVTSANGPNYEDCPSDCKVGGEIVLSSFTVFILINHYGLLTTQKQDGVG